jgi:hypothetical protein
VFAAKRPKRGETIPLDPAMTVVCISSGGVVLLGKAAG